MVVIYKFQVNFPRFFQLGVIAAFGNEADFSPISGDVLLKVSAVTHVATVEVTTEGTVGAAASGKSFSTKITMKSKKCFTVL